MSTSLGWSAVLTTFFFTVNLQCSTTRGISWPVLVVEAGVPHGRRQGAPVCRRRSAILAGPRPRARQRQAGGAYRALGPAVDLLVIILRDVGDRVRELIVVVGSVADFLVLVGLHERVEVFERRDRRAHCWRDRSHGTGGNDLTARGQGVGADALYWLHL